MEILYVSVRRWRARQRQREAVAEIQEREPGGQHETMGACVGSREGERPVYDSCRNRRSLIGRNSILLDEII